MSQRKRRKSKPPPVRRKVASSSAPSALVFKVVELSTVDENSIEHCLNAWSQKGWQFDGMQFAMRESSRRPAMAFLLFTRQGSAETTMAENRSETLADFGPNPEAARWRLSRMAEEDTSGGRP